MRTDLISLLWPASRSGEALDVLCRESGIATGGTIRNPAEEMEQGARVFEWLRKAGAAAGVELEETESRLPDVRKNLMAAAPALVRIDSAEASGYLVLLRSSGAVLTVIAPDLSKCHVRGETVSRELCDPLCATAIEEAGDALQRADVPASKRERAAQAISNELLHGTRVGGLLLVRAAPQTSFERKVFGSALPRQFSILTLSHLAEYLLWIASWWMISNATLQGRLDRGWLLAWGLVLLSIVPCKLLAQWLEGRVSIGVGLLFKQHLLYGALRLHPDELRSQGAGQFLARVIESDAVESLGLTGGLAAVMAAIELALAVVVLSFGADALWLLMALTLWLVVVVAAAWAYMQRYASWSTLRLEMTNLLVEHMVGSRTRVVQERPARWHDEEDGQLAQYYALSQRLDRAATTLVTLVPHGWLIVAIAALAPALIARTATLPVAIALGGVLLAFQALRSITFTISHLVGAIVASRQVLPLFRSASRPLIPADPIATSRTEQVDEASAGVALYAHGLSYRHQGRRRRTLRDCSLELSHGDRVLVSGPSGEGKSTLASILYGLRMPEAGVLLIDGLDRYTVGDNVWARYIAAAPQFQENHIFTGTLAYNLLMGKRWPADPEDQEAAEKICIELGLGPLLARMPSGLQQIVGDGGWQLSHGERSRIFIARALLQDCSVVVLDESFAGLDAENLRAAVECVRKHAQTLLVIAHP